MTTKVLRQDVDQLARSGLEPAVTAPNTKLGEIQAARARLWHRIEAAEQAVQDPATAQATAESLTVDDVRDHYRRQIAAVGRERAKRTLQAKGHSREERATYALRVDLLRQQLASMNPDDVNEALVDATSRRDGLTLEAVLEAPQWQDLRPPDEFAGEARAALDRARGLDEVVACEEELAAFEAQLANADAAVREIKAKAEAAAA